MRGRLASFAGKKKKMNRHYSEKKLYEVTYFGYDGLFREEELELIDPVKYATNLEEYGCQGIAIYDLETGDCVYEDGCPKI